MPSRPPVDVAINVYGKPYQTAVTLLSLLKHSGQWIDKIYFIEERKQPQGTDFSFLYPLLGDKLIRYRPWFWLWTNPFKKEWLMKLPFIRRAIRYQYAWEKSDKKFLLVTHNDVLYEKDLVGVYLSEIGDHIGVGKVGQCWNCPAYFANKCNSEKYWDYRPSKEEVQELVRQHPGARTVHFDYEMNRRSSWPIPECRLNEYTAMLNLDLARPLTTPQGPATAFGNIDGLDTATGWFWSISNAGYRVKHVDFDPYATHDWTGGMNSGHAALFDHQLYEKGELIAKEYLIQQYGLDV
ncbi:hypothetical protein [Siphonobacter sp.]|uniref:hypothetical protein n=1 Tax=Siphonobacter sp. TaxID=1869184 RepID=UPI003B3B80C5